MNTYVAITAIVGFICFAIGWLAMELEPAAEDPNEAGVWPL